LDRFSVHENIVFLNKMTQDVRQWLDEIKRLQQQLATVQRDRDAAFESAQQWRQLYSTEAQQRREETQLYQETVAALEAEIEQLQQKLSIPQNEILARVAIQQELDQLQDPDELKAKLKQTMLERDRAQETIRQLNESLEQEQASHQETRNSLTTALGDTVDLLTKAQGRSPFTTTSATPEHHSEQLLQPQQSLPKLPPIEQQDTET
jgi:chromosome segregation ATPase